MATATATAARGRSSGVTAASDRGDIVGPYPHQPRQAGVIADSRRRVSQQTTIASNGCRCGERRTRSSFCFLLSDTRPRAGWVIRCDALKADSLATRCCRSTSCRLRISDAGPQPLRSWHFLAAPDSAVDLRVFVARVSSASAGAPAYEDRAPARRGRRRCPGVLLLTRPDRLGADNDRPEHHARSRRAAEAARTDRRFISGLAWMEHSCRTR